MATLKEIFDRQFQDVKFDRNLCARIIGFSNNFMTRTHEHAEFFGGVLIGVNTIRFLERDRERWYDEVLDVDETSLVQDFKENATAVNMNFNVMSDVFNYTPIYLAYRLHKETSIPLKLRQDASIHAFVVLHCRFITSLLFRRFSYNAQREVAQSAYNSLSMRFDIRKNNSWRELFESRGEEIVFKNPLYRQAVQQYMPDKKVIDLVTTTQGRLRELINNYYSVYIDTVKSGSRVKGESATMVTTDGETILRDRTKGYATYHRYIREVAQRENDFIRKELITVVTSVVKTAPPELVENTLRYLSANIGRRGRDYMDKMVTDTVVFLMDYLSKQRGLLRQNDLGKILNKLRTVMTASGSRDPNVLRVREYGDTLVKDSYKGRTPSVVIGIRTSVILYIALRTLTKDHYSS